MPNPITDYLRRYDYENLVVCQEASAGLLAFIAIHDTTLGPAAGGTRVWTYPSEWDAIEDALRLARGMTYKYAAGGVNLGGGKCVVMVEPQAPRGEALFRTLGRFIERLGGMFLTGADVGTDMAEMRWLRTETSRVITLPRELGGAGDIAAATAHGVRLAMRAGAERAFGSDDLAGRCVLLQGVGKVGRHLARLLAADGALLSVADPDPAAVRWASEELDGAEIVDPAAVFEHHHDIYSPCALGRTLTPETVPRIAAKLVAGSANNQLADEAVGALLEERGIVYVPDYVANAGGAVYDADRLTSGAHQHERAMVRVDAIGTTTRRVFELADREGVPADRAADLYAEARIQAVRQLQSLAVAPAVKL